MFNPICLFVDAFLAVFLAINAILEDLGLGAIGIPQEDIDSMFELFLFTCGFNGAD